MNKGTTLVGSLRTIRLAKSPMQGGWGFNPYWFVIDEYGETVRREPGQTINISNDQLRFYSFFTPFDPPTIYEGSGWAQIYRAEVLAQGIPALSWPAGRNDIPDFGVGKFMMDSQMDVDGWPLGRLGAWLHSDFREVALVYTKGVYLRFLEFGDLDK